MRTEGIGYTVGFSFLITFGIAFILSGVQFATVERVELNDLERRKSVVLTSMGVEIEDLDRDALFAAYAELEQLSSDVWDDGFMYRGFVAGEPVYARSIRGPGVWGDIVAVVSVNSDASRVVGVAILEQNETPGLGGRVTSDAFLSQLKGERIGPDGIYVEKRGPGDADPDNAKIDGITGATGTTRAFDRLLNREVRALREAVRRSAQRLSEA